MQQGKIHHRQHSLDCISPFLVEGVPCLSPFSYLRVVKLTRWCFSYSQSISHPSELFSCNRYYLNDADYFVKADIDSFVVVENLRAYLSFYSPDEPHYLGHTLMHEWVRFNLCFNSGVGYVLSRETLRRLETHAIRNRPNHRILYGCQVRSAALIRAWHRRDSRKEVSVL